MRLMNRRVMDMAYNTEETDKEDVGNGKRRQVYVVQDSWVVRQYVYRRCKKKNCPTILV